MRNAAQQQMRVNPNSMDAMHVRHNNPMAFIQLNNFISAIEMVLNDIKLDPYILVYKLLLTFYSGQEQLTMSNFKKFFARFETYFEGNDIKIFLKEIALF